jgi:hypothetical protein
MGSRRTSVAFATLFATLLASGLALAQPSAADRETARSLMEEGDKKRESSDLKGALKAYEAADAIMKVPTTGLEVARTQAALGLLIEAKETLSKVLRIPPRPNEPAPFTAARKAADTMNTEITAKIPSIQVTVSNADPQPAPQVLVDGDPIPPAAASVPRKVNPGNHVVLVRASGTEKRQEVSVLERDTKVVNIDFKDAKELTAKPVDTPKPKPSGGGSYKGMMYGGFGVAVVGVGVGAVTGLMSISKTNELKEICPNNGCPAGKQGDIDSATSLGNISTVAFVIGGIGLGVGIVGLVLSNGDKKEPPATAARAFAPERIRAVLGPSYAGVAGSF